jgi:CRP/FNR family transcriptional regulator, cyclic AMP receptor protein
LKVRTLETLEEMIVNHPFWAGLNLQHFDLLKKCATFQRYEAGQSIFQEGENADHFYLIQKGRVTLHAFVPGRGAVTVQTVGGGDALGWSWLFPPHQWHFSAHSSESTEAIVFGAKLLRDEAERNHDFGYELTKRVSKMLLQRLQETRLLLMDFYGLPS